MNNLEDVLGGETEIETQKESLEVETSEDKKQDELVQKKQEQLENLNRAIQEANEQLRNARTTRKTTLEDIPRIDFEDPSAQAWDKHIKESVDPLQKEVEKEKEEIFDLSLRKFLNDNPYIASKPEKLKELVEVYQRNNTSSGRVAEMVYNNLQKSAAFLFHDELISQVRENRIKGAKADALFSDPSISRGSTAYSRERESSPAIGLTDEEKQIILRMGYKSIEEWAADKKKYQ